MKIGPAILEILAIYAEEKKNYFRQNFLFLFFKKMFRCVRNTVFVAESGYKVNFVQNGSISSVARF